MRPVTNDFLEAIRAGHPINVKAYVCAPGQVGLSPVGTEIPVIDGSITMDSTADITSTLDLTTSYTWPIDEYGNPTGIGKPYGEEIFVQYGVVYGNGTTEYVGLGYYRIESVEQQRTPNGTFRIVGSDRMINVVNGRRISPIQFGSGASVQATIDFLLTEVMPAAISIYDAVNWPGGTAATTVLGSSHICDRDRLKFLQELINAYAKTMYFDYAGRLQVKDRPDPTKAAVFTVNHGSRGVLVEMRRELTSDGVYNAVVAQGEPVGEQAAVTGVAYDLVTTSPTYFNGDFGPKPYFFSSSFLKTDAQCLASAQAQLVALTGLPYIVQLDVAPNPALEAGDVISVTYTNGLSPETHIIDRLTIPLKYDGRMSIETRKQYL